MDDLTKSSCVRQDETAHHSKCKRDLDSLLQLRHGVLLNTSRQARAACGAVSGRIASTTVKSRGGDFQPSSLLNRVATTNRVRRGAGEGMAQGRATAQPCLIGRPSSSYCERAGCNSAERDYRRLGTGNHWPRLFKSEAIRPTKNVCHAKQITTRTLLWGWFSSLLSLPRMFHHWRNSNTFSPLTN